MTDLYSILVFEPEILPTYDDKTILWKIQLDVPKNYNSIILNLISDNIYLNNRRLLKNWYDFFEDNNIKFKNTFESEYCQELKIYDENDLVFKLQLFACDIKASNYKVEIEHDLIIPILYILDIKKNGVINPILLQKKIDNAKLILSANTDNNGGVEKNILKYFQQIIKLLDHCNFYEHDVKFFIQDR